MTKDKKSFLMYCDWKDLFDGLDDEKSGQLIKHIFSYVNDEDPQTEDVVIKTAFSLIKQQFKRDLKKYEALCSKNQANANKRWDATASERTPTDAKHADTDIDTGIDTDKEKRKTKKNKLTLVNEFYEEEKKQSTDNGEYAVFVSVLIESTTRYPASIILLSM